MADYIERQTAIKALTDVSSDQNCPLFVAATIERVLSEIPAAGNSGVFNIGNRNTGDWNAGDRNTGNRNTGSRNAGDRNTGSRNAGDWNAGDRNTGSRNSGNGNSGDWNTGDWNSGKGNTGDWNSGNGNSGDWNSCNYSNGFFCSIDDPDIRIFNKPSGMSYLEFVNSKYYMALCSAPLRIAEWIEYSKDEMDTDEKKALGGYLKKRSYFEACALWWDELTEENKKIITEIPNFDADIFYQITGIDLREKSE